MLYLVIAGQHEPYIVERNLPDCSWDATVRDIADMHFSNLKQVVEVGTGRDVTEQIVKEAAFLRSKEDRENSFEFAQLVELTCGTRFARPFFQRAA